MSTSVDTDELFGIRNGRVIVPPGRYLIGDLCYSVGHDHAKWDKYLDNQVGDDGKPYSGIGDSYRGILMGFPAASFQTAHGDGEYECSDGRSFPVDSGTIGIMAWPQGDAPEGMHVVEFTEEQSCLVTNGEISLGDITIDTDPSFDEDEDEEEEPESEDDEEDEPSDGPPGHGR